MSSVFRSIVSLRYWPSLVNERRSLPGLTDDFAPLIGDEEHYSWRHPQLLAEAGLLLNLMKDLERITGIAGPEVRFLRTWPYASVFFFSLLHGDGSDDRARKAKAVALADVLPLLPARKYLHRLELPERH